MCLLPGSSGYQLSSRAPVAASTRIQAAAPGPDLVRESATYHFSASSQPQDTLRRKAISYTATAAALSEKARGKGLPMADMSGGCFTLSSLGHIGGTGFTPIINAPEVAILGITRTQDRFLPDEDGRPVRRQLLPLSLSYDHRVINGADAARFVRSIGDFLQAFDFS